MRMKHFIRRSISLMLAGLILFGVGTSLFIDTAATAIYLQPDLSDYDDYQAFIDKWSPPDYIVRYSYIRELGAYRDCWLPQTTPPGFFPGNNFKYRLEDANDRAILLIVRDTESKVRYEQLPARLAGKDMRTLKTEDTGVIQRGPLTYCYNQGKLDDIWWTLGSTQLTICMDYYQDSSVSLSDYPLDGEDTIVSRLLSGNYLTALFAYYDMVGDIPLQPEETAMARMQHILPVVLVPVVIAVASATVYILLRRRKRKLAANLEEDISSTELE